MSTEPVAEEGGTIPDANGGFRTKIHFIDDQQFVQLIMAVGAYPGHRGITERSWYAMARRIITVAKISGTLPIHDTKVAEWTLNLLKCTRRMYGINLCHQAAMEYVTRLMRGEYEHDGVQRKNPY